VTDNSSSAEDRGMTLKELVHRLLRHWILIGSIWAGVMIAVVAWTFLAAERFMSTAVVRIMEDPSELGLAQQLGDLPEIVTHRAEKRLVEEPWTHWRYPFGAASRRAPYVYEPLQPSDPPAAAPRDLQIKAMPDD